MEFLLSVIGLVLVIEGIPYFAFPEQMKALLARMPEVPTRTLRLFGTAAIGAGIVLIYIAKKVLS
ncbi:MAG: DUF2065 domain-containing protein [Desulfobacterota bacterium]|nr:DUF2065 domain-containing protein [Thermodesulfobacteriota bacterium]